MSRKRIIVERRILEGYIEVHPALDFYNGKAIVAIGRPGLTSYDDDSRSFEQYSVCITSDGDLFILSPNEMIDRKLYYLKDLDLPSNQWEISNQEQFLKSLLNGNKPDIDLAVIHSSIKRLFVELFDFQDEKLYDFFPTFIIYTYFFPLFESAPVVHLWGPAGSGKTKVMEMLSLMAFNPVTSGNITEASVFRLVEGRRAVCLLDESEDLSKTERGKAIINLVLNGYRRGSKIYRSDKMGKTITSSHYDVFSPKVIANITGLTSEAMVSRAIRVVTSSSHNVSKANRFTVEIKDKATDIRNQLYQACLVKFKDIEIAKTSMPQIGLRGRSAEIWQGVLSIAWLVNGEAWHNVSWLAIESSKALEEELVSSNPVWDLLETLLDFVPQGKPKFITTESLHQHLASHKGDTFGSKRQITLMLKQQGFKTTWRRINGRGCRGMILERDMILEKLNTLTGIQFEVKK